jgi:branched-chain amino acid transport system substrate-binding protein
MLGPYSSGQTKAVLPVIERHKVPLVQGNGEARDLFTRGSRYHFTVLSTSDQYLVPVIEFAAEHAEKLGKTKESLRIALAMADEPFAQDVRAGLLDAIMRHGMNVVIDDQLPTDLDDMSFTLERVKALRPDLLLISGQKQGALTAITQIEQLQVEVPMIGMTHCEAAGIAEKLDASDEYVLCTHQWHRSLSHKGELFGTAEDFAREFEQTHNYEAPGEAAQAAAAVQVFADAFGRARSLDAETVRKAIKAIAATELQTFFAPIEFDAAGRNVAKSMVLTQIQDGKYLVVSPAPLADGRPVVPGEPD